MRLTVFRFALLALLVLSIGAVETARAVDAADVIEGLQKIANRVASGLVLAALIIGAALLMRVETDFRVLGYPGFAILCFIGAALGGVFLLVNIYLQDRRAAKRR